MIDITTMMKNISEETLYSRETFKKEYDNILDHYGDEMYLITARDRLSHDLYALFQKYKNLGILKSDIHYILGYDYSSSIISVKFIDKNSRYIDMDKIFKENALDCLIESLKILDEKITKESKELSNNYVNITPEGYYWLEKWNKNRQSELLNEIISFVKDNKFDDSFLYKIEKRVYKYINYFDIVKAEPSVDIISYTTSIYTQILLQLKGGIKNENN